MAEASIKGVLFVQLVERMLKQRDEGQLSSRQLERWLTPDDVALLDTKLLPSGWYPVAAEGRMLRCLLEEIGEGRMDYLVEVGRDSARQSVAFYRQVQTLAQKTEGVRQELAHARNQGASLAETAARSEAAYRSMAAQLLALYRQFFNFGEIRSEPVWRKDVVTGWTIELADVAAFPDELVPTACGFDEGIGELMLGRRCRAEASRPTPERIVIRLESVRSSG